MCHNNEFKLIWLLLQIERKFHKTFAYVTVIQLFTNKRACKIVYIRPQSTTTCRSKYILCEQISSMRKDLFENSDFPCSQFSNFSGWNGAKLWKVYYRETPMCQVNWSKTDVLGEERPYLYQRHSISNSFPSWGSSYCEPYVFVLWGLQCSWWACATRALISLVTHFSCSAKDNMRGSGTDIEQLEQGRNNVTNFIVIPRCASAQFG